MRFFCRPWCCRAGHKKGRKQSAPFNWFQLDEITIAQLRQAYKNGDYTIRRVVQMYINRIEAIDDNGPELNSVIVVNPDALAIADSLDRELAAGKSRGPLHGIPVLLKDNIDTHDKMPTTAGSRVLKDSYPPHDSWVAEKLRDAGAVILGKANLSEWANYRASFSSSSGPAVAVSANLCAVAIGSETWGSIMCPANANGIVGIKPTVGLWSRSGIVPISYTQDTAGPMARSVEDAAVVLGAVVGVDSSDAKTLGSQNHYYSDYTQFLNKEGLRGKRIGRLKTTEGRNFKVDSLMHQAVRFLRSQGADIIDLDKLVEGTPCTNSEIVLSYEFKDGLAAYFARLGEKAPVHNLKDVIAATLADSLEMLYFDIHAMEASQARGDLQTPEYKQALHDMLLAYREQGIDRVMNEYDLDAIVSPTGGPAWKTDLINGDNFVLSTSVNAALSGYPNINVPLGFIGDVPVGLSFYGRAWSEPLLLKIAYSYEQGTKHRRPPRFLPTD